MKNACFRLRSRLEVVIATEGYFFEEVYKKKSTTLNYLCGENKAHKPRENKHKNIFITHKINIIID